MIGRLAGLVALLATTVAHATEPRGIGSHFPELQLVASDGGEQSLSGYRPPPVLLVVWAHWCAPCREEMPSLAALDEAWAKPRGVRILLLSFRPAEFDKDVALAHRLAPTLAAVRTREPLAADELYALFGVENLRGARIPKAVLLDGEGRVRFLNDNSRDWTELGPLMDRWLSRDVP